MFENNACLDLIIKVAIFICLDPQILLRLQCECTIRSRSG